MNRGEFTRAVFEKMHIPISPERLYFGVAWAQTEGSEARNNPWDTTEPYPDSTDYNSVGVKNYKTWEDGINATVSTLILEYYKDLVAVLKKNNPTGTQMVEALRASPWGTEIEISDYNEVRNKYDFYNTEIVGSPKEFKSTTAQALAPTVASVVPTRSDVLEEDESEGVMTVPTEDTLESRLAKLYGDVKEDGPKVEADIKQDVLEVETQFDALRTPTPTPIPTSTPVPVMPGYKYDSATDTYVKDTTTSTVAPETEVDTLEARLAAQDSAMNIPESNEHRLAVAERRVTVQRRSGNGRRNDSARRMTEVSTAPVVGTSGYATSGLATPSLVTDGRVLAATPDAPAPVVNAPERRVTNTVVPASLERRSSKPSLLSRIKEGL